jgi:hypothetical protein
MTEREGPERRVPPDEEIARLNSDISFDADWDSPNRRQETLRRLAQHNIEPEFVKTRMLADTDQARHPRDAVRAPIGNATKARHSAPLPTRVREQPSR